MNKKELKNFCHSFKGVEERFPFDKKTLAFSVNDKVFCLTNIETYNHITIKCDPEIAIKLRKMYNNVIPGFYMNKSHWNSVILNGDIPVDIVKEWIRNSYDLVVLGLPKKIQKYLRG